MRFLRILARGMSDDDVAILQLHTKHGVGQQLDDDAGKSEQFFFHSILKGGPMKRPAPRRAESAYLWGTGQGNWRFSARKPFMAWQSGRPAVIKPV